MERSWVPLLCFGFLCSYHPLERCIYRDIDMHFLYHTKILGFRTYETLASVSKTISVTDCAFTTSRHLESTFLSGSGCCTWYRIRFCVLLYQKCLRNTQCPSLLMLYCQRPFEWPVDRLESARRYRNLIERYSALCFYAVFSVHAFLVIGRIRYWVSTLEY